MNLILSEDKAHKLQVLATELTGIPYKFGDKAQNLDEEPDKIIDIDCSGLVRYMYHKIGYDIVDGSGNQYEITSDVLEPEIGDLVFKKDTNGVVIHVGMIISQSPADILTIEASGSFGRVLIRPLVDFKVYPIGKVFAGVRRLITEKVTVNDIPVSSPIG